MDIDLSLLGWAHSLACVVAVAAGIVIFASRKGGRRHRLAGRVFVVSMAAVCVSALGIYANGRWFFPHTLSVVTLGVLAIGFAAVRFKRPAGWWIYVHLNAMIGALYLLAGGAVNEAFLRVNALSALNEAMNFAPLGMTHMAVMAAFILWAGIASFRAPRRFAATRSRVAA